ncbi:MAG: glycosyltransferase family 39 protein, partial [Anaerolineales bacterium]|nr:glycosyltransferase family 39 protein [Anaerolineales bacterium]
MGRTILGWLCLAPPDTPRQWVYGSALGLGLIGYGIFALSTLHWVSSVTALALLGLSAVIGLPLLIQSARELVRAARAVRITRVSAFGVSAAGLFGLHFVVNLISCFNPPIDLDTLGYHLTIPKLNILHNDFVFRTDIAFTHWPLQQEMLYQLALLVGDDALAHLIALLIAGLAAGALWACARPHFAPRIAALAALIFFTIPVVGYEASIAYVDVGVALFALLAWFAWCEWRATRDDRWLWVSALMAGFAPATKLSGAFVPALLVGAVWLFAPKEKNRWLCSIGYGALAGLAVAPWLIRTWLQTGNPVAPYFFDLIGARGWTAHAAHGTTTFVAFGQGHDLVAALMLPWNITMFSTHFGGGNIGPIFLSALP